MRLVCTLALALAAGCVTPAIAGGDSPLSPQETKAWLVRIQDAASHRNFKGTFMVNAGGAVSNSRIAHFCVGASQFESIESLDGQVRRVYRHDGLVQTVWPASRVALVEQRDLLATFPALVQTGSDRIVTHYDVHSRGTERMAGRDADVLLLRPKDDRRFGYRLWADRDTGLLLRVEVLGERGEVLESSAFSDLTIGIKAQPDSVLLPMKKLEGYRVVRPSLTPARLDAEGWRLRQEVPGFEQVSCVRRLLTGPSDGADDAAMPVLQTIFSDGLTHVSVFIEPYDPTLHKRGMRAAIGATQTLMRRLGDWWVTVVGDVPGATLRQFADALEYRK